MIKHVLGSDSLTVYLDHKPYTINKQAHNYKMVLDAIRNDSLDALRAALDIRAAVIASLTASTDSNDVKITGSQIFYKDREVTGLITSRIFETIRLGLSALPMVKFIENLMQNPSKRAVDELFVFLDACKLPITDDGHFLAYKRVRDNYMDVHSGKFDNSVGKALSMPRNLVDEDKNNTCSYGLHFCSYSYLDSFDGERIMVVKINPKDVVAIPADYNNSKGRTCAYTVVDEIPLDEFNKTMPAKPLNEGYTSAYGSGDSEDNGWDESEWEESWEESNESVDVDEEIEWLTREDIDSLMDECCAGFIELSDLADTYGISVETLKELMLRNDVDGAGDKVEAEEEQNPPVDNSVKLTAKCVRQIRRLLKKGDSLASIGRAYRVHPRTIARIRDGEAWSDV